MGDDAKRSHDRIRPTAGYKRAGDSAGNKFIRSEGERAGKEVKNRDYGGLGVRVKIQMFGNLVARTFLRIIVRPVALEKERWGGGDSFSESPIGSNLVGLFLLENRK